MHASGLSFRATLLIILVLGAGPILAFSGFLLSRYADSERQRAERGLVESAKGIASAIDAQFAAAEAALLALSALPAFDHEDIAAIDERLRRTAQETGRHFVLVQRDGQQRVNTFLSSGRALPRNDPDLWDPVFASGKTHVTNVFPGASTGQLLAGVGVPVRRDGAVKYALSSGIFAKDMARFLDQPGVPQDWIVSIVDRHGRHLVRSRNNDQFAGKPLVPELIAYMESGREGTITSTSLEGIPLISTVQRARNSGWGAAVGLPTSVLDQPLRASLRDLGLVALLVIGAGSGLAFWIARSLDRSVGALTSAAAGFGRGEPPELPQSIVREVNAVGAVLVQASSEIRSLTLNLEAQVAERTNEIRKANAELLAEIQRRNATEERMAQMQKIEAIGQLTGGIAHDFNNMLAIVLGSLRLLKRRLARGEGIVTTYVDSAMEGAERAASLTARLLAFSRQQPLAPTAVDINARLTGMREILHRTIPENVRIEFELAEDLWLAYADVQGFESAVINLAANARDAMPDGGSLLIDTANIRVDEGFASAHPEMLTGEYVMITVSDTGCGMTPDVLSQAFDPFFTTKPTDRGTGLGLSQVHGYAKQSGGHIAIQSAPGEGTSVRLYLPRFSGSMAAVEKEKHGEAGIPRSANGETILVVEDDADVRRLTVEMLHELGYRTIEAGNADAALSLLDSHPEVALLYTDVIMPGRNGRQLATEAQLRRPNLPVLFTTGYAKDAIVHHGILDPDVRVIFKPHTFESLARSIRDALRPISAQI